LGSSAIQVKYYTDTLPKDSKITPLKLSNNQYKKLVKYIETSLKRSKTNNSSLILPKNPKVLTENNSFYDAKQTYSLLLTCNTWINNGLKASGQKRPMPEGFFISMKNSFFVLFLIGLPLFSIAQENFITKTSEKHVLIFINGYRGPKFNKLAVDNTLYTKDPTGYWYKYDDTIINRFKPIQTLYFSAHHPISSSVHKTKFNIATSYLFSRFCWISKKSRWVLRNKFNSEGFELRFSNGIIAGQNVIDYLEKNFLDSTIKVHIISHSMGYAYSLGLVSQIKTKVKFGKMLAISPESGGFQGADWNLFDEVWQYGCKMGEKESDVIFYQDGIAPQQTLKGLEKVSINKGGRIYPPTSWPKKNKGFNKSHHLKWFQWFYNIKEEDRGFFGPNISINSTFEK
jgi:hypothetical protein